MDFGRNDSTDRESTQKWILVEMIGGHKMDRERTKSGFGTGFPQISARSTRLSGSR